MKPQNILVSQFDEPVLADFGVATLQAQAQSTEGVFGFTTLHAPPEALEGLPLSPSADIYGLASSMYQLLVGRGPFSSYEGEAPASVILRILRDPAPAGTRHRRARRPRRPHGERPGQGPGQTSPDRRRLSPNRSARSKPSPAGPDPLRRVGRQSGCAAPSADGRRSAPGPTAAPNARSSTASPTAAG